MKEEGEVRRVDVGAGGERRKGEEAIGAEVGAEEVEDAGEEAEERKKRGRASVDGSGCELSSIVSPSEASMAQEGG